MTEVSQNRQRLGLIHNLEQRPRRFSSKAKRRVDDSDFSRTELDAQTEEFGPVRPDWRAEDPSRRAIRVTGQAGDIRGGNLIGCPASGNKAAAGLGIDFE